VLAVAPEEVACRRGDAGTWTSQPASVTGSGNSPELATKPTALSGPEERADGRDRCHRASELTAGIAHSGRFRSTQQAASPGLAGCSDTHRA